MSLWNAVYSVHLCFSVRGSTHPLDEIRTMKVAGEFFLSRRVFFSLTERTEVTEVLSARFRAHRRPSAYRVHRALLPKMAVRFCEIGWLNVSVRLCVFCSSVIFCEKKNNCETRWGVLSLTERTEFTEAFGAQFWAHRRPSAYRVHRAFQLKKGVGCWVLGADD